MAKRAFDCAVALTGLICLWPFLFVMAVLIKLDSDGPVIFSQERIGRGSKPFRIYKFRTMITGADKGRQITCGDDPRITRVGRVLRKAKLDELPQLLNVLKGDMSLVGPRPEVPRYVDRFRAEYAEILTVRPGITDAASVKFWNEAALLGSAPDPDVLYERLILPEKIALGQQYVHQASFVTDLAIVFNTCRAAMFKRPE